MCGIAGMFRESGCDEASLVRMRDALVHRGPDDAGFWIGDDRRVGLAQRRLSIIAPGPDGHQPICNEDGTIWLVFNGEIYNYVDLRRQLELLGHRFRSRSDTETIVHAYEEWGENCASHLRGMFAFAIWDGARQRLVLGRDHTGIKPMFYYWDGRTFAFASEIKAFWQLDGMDRGIDRSAIFDYLTYLYVPAPKTAYSRVRKLAPGHWLRFEAGSLIEREYWDVPLQQDESLTEEAATELVRQQLHDAVAANMVSDVPVGAFLSGGLDSSTVVSYMADLTADPVRAFSIGFDVLEHSETEYARQAATAFGASYRERVVGRESIRTLLPRLRGIYDEPYSDGSAMPTLHVCELAREEVKVALSGDGGDE
ncbi:MAG TPA: asparagine synthase (glutamine-hydrolyzing), partial [Rhodothermales bacterium]